jgi:O-antigen ligase
LAWKVFATAPVTGAGLGATSAYLREFSTPLGLVVHNEYLRVAAETGLIGLGLLLLALWQMLRAPFRAPVAASSFVDECRATAAGAFAAFAVVSITDNPLDYYAPVMQYLWFLLACGVGSFPRKGTARALGRPA